MERTRSFYFRDSKNCGLQHRKVRWAGCVDKWGERKKDSMLGSRSILKIEKKIKD